MKLTRLRIEALPGIRPGFALTDIAPGVNVVLGPNASGKSSLCRALRALLYREEQPAGFVHVEADFHDAGAPLHVARMGREIRWMRAGRPVPAPLLPEYRFLSCYLIAVDELIRGGETEGLIAEHVGRELAGGYDLRLVGNTPPFKLKSNHARAEAAALREAQAELAQRRREQGAIRADELRLAKLAGERRAAEAAAREAVAWRVACEALEARAARAAQERHLGVFPAGMKRLRGDEEARLAEARSRIEELERARAASRQELEIARARLAELEPATTDAQAAAPAPDPATVRSYRERVGRLRDLEGELRHLAEQERAAGARLDEATRDLGGEAPADEVRLDPETLTEVELRLARKRELDASLRVLDAEIARLGSDRGETLQPDRLRAGRAELLRWLAAPPPAPRTRAHTAAALALGMAALAIVAAAVATGQAYLALVLLPLAVVFAILLRPAGDGGRRREEAVGRYRELGLELPPGWEEAAVRTQLEALDRALRDAEADLSRCERAQEVRRERTRLGEECERVAAELAVHARKVGFDPQRLDASFERWLRLVQSYDEARLERAECASERTARAAEAESLSRTLREFLERHGEPVAAELAGGRAVALAAALERLEARQSAGAQARERAQRAAAEIERIEHERERNARSLDAILQAAGVPPGDEATLRERLGHLADWQQAERALVAAQGAERDRMAKLHQRPDLAALVERADEAALRTRIDELDADAARRDAITAEIARIEAAVERARGTRALEETRARRQAAADGLQERLDEALFAAAGELVLSEVEREHRAESEPEVLRQADVWLRRFTRNHYALEFDPAGAGVFLARDNHAEEYRRLEELSSGTRMQLLLAVRLAFALAAEKGRTPLPLFLDEALTTADPERFRAVVESVHVLADEGDRQVFYLTAQPGDARLWRAEGAGNPPHVIDLGMLRRRAAAIAEPAHLALPPEAPVPAPNGRTPEAYALALGVPGIDPWAPLGDIHLFHLLRDRLGLLHRLLRAGVERIGALRSLLDSGAAAALFTSEEIEILRERVAVATRWFEARRTGRGRPLGRAALEACPAVTATFVDALAAVCTAAGGDAAAVLEAIDRGEIKRFRARARQELEAWLLAEGYLDERERLTVRELEHRVLAELHAAGAENTRARLDPGLVHELLRALEAGVGAGRSARRVEEPLAGTSLVR